MASSPSYHADQTEALASELLEKIGAYTQHADVKMIEHAYRFAKDAHEGQLRKSGEPYIMHPLRTALVLATLHVDQETIIAGLLHDVPEDTAVPLFQIEREFGPKIAYLVDGITKLAKVHYRERMEQRQIESLQKLFIHSAEDLRVILIKLADRLDNMRTLKFIAAERKRHRIASETLEIYVPIANLLGIGEIRTELEDLCFQNLRPLEYDRLKREVEVHIEERTFILDEIIRIAQKELKKNNIEAEVVGRPKTLYSIFRKLQTKKNIYNIDDLIAIRVIVPTRKDCYETLGIIHHLFKPKTTRVKDYIAVPKPNGYQSLHTTVFGLSSNVVEFQIRTRYMHLEAEYGIAAHYFYKYETEGELTSTMKQRASWIQRILEISKNQKDPANFLEHLKLDVFQDRIFVFSPKGDVIDLPRSACALDFAYAIHGEIGNHAEKAEINGILAPVTTMLQSGDTIRIMTDKKIVPQAEWLSFAKTSLATTKIKEYLKLQPLSIKQELGKNLLQKEFYRMGKNIEKELTPRKLRAHGVELPYASVDDLFIAAAEGEITTEHIRDILFKKEAQEPETPMTMWLRVIGDNSKQQFGTIFATLNSLNILIKKFQIDRSWYLNKDRCKIKCVVKNYSEVAQIFESIENLDGVEKISRLFLSRTILFYLATAITGLLWLTHPFLINALLSDARYGVLTGNLVMYGGLLMLFGLTMYVRKIARRTLPELTETNYYWPTLFGTTTLALFIVFGEITTFHLIFAWQFVIGLIAGIFGLLIASFVRYKKQR